MKKIIQLADGGPQITAEVTKAGIFAIHKPLGVAKGYVMTHIPSGMCVMLFDRKKEATDFRKEIESLPFDQIRCRVFNLLQPQVSV
jgi:hypothetical protein